VTLSLFETMQGHISDYRNGGSKTKTGAPNGN